VELHKLATRWNFLKLAEVNSEGIWRRMNGKFWGENKRRLWILARELRKSWGIDEKIEEFR
jgi:hypothetical protein